MRMSSQDSTSCGRQKLLDCSLSTPTLLHHDTAGGDDVRMSAGLLATSDKDAMSIKTVNSLWLKCKSKVKLNTFN
jgi:hypothetical protein